MNTGLLPTDLAYMQALFAREPAIDRVWLFGSRATNTHHTGSDVDLVLMGETLTEPVVARIHDILEEESPIPYFFDVLNWHTLTNEALKTAIQQTATLLYQRTPSAP